MTAVAETGENRATVSEVTLPDDLRSLATLDRIDYFDSYLLAGVPERTAERWARAMLEDAPAPTRAQLVVGWTAIGLDLTLPTSARGVLGWRIAYRTRETLVLSAGSRLGLAGNLVYAVRPEGLHFATFTQQTNRVARAAWERIVPQHQGIVRSLLRKAGDREIGAA